MTSLTKSKETSEIWKMKIDMRSPIDEFRIPGYTSTFHLDYDQHGVRIAVFIKQTKLMQCLNIELNFC